MRRRGWRQRLALGVSACVAAVAVTVGAAPAASAQPERTQRTVVPNGSLGPSRGFLEGYVKSVLRPGVMPEGVNDWTCKLTKEHPRPVVLIHGTWDNAYATWSSLAPQLHDNGFCVYALNFGDDEQSALGFLPGVYGTQDLRISEQEVAHFIDQVLERTGASQVDLVGHSQGGIMMRQYIQKYGGWNPSDPSKNKVHTAVGYAPNYHGTTLSGIAALGDILQKIGLPVLTLASFPLGLAGIQQAIGSPYIYDMNKNGDTRPGIRYVNLGTQYDWNVSPYTSGFLAHEPGSDVTNIRLQDGCKVDYSEHLVITLDPRANWYAKQALGATGIGDTPPCVFVAPFTRALPFLHDEPSARSGMEELRAKVAPHVKKAQRAGRTPR